MFVLARRDMSFVAGVYALGRSFTHRSHFSHCPARLEAAGVHFTDQQSSAVPLENHERQRVYDSIQQDFRASGLSLDGTITQGLTMSDLFQVYSAALYLTENVVAAWVLSEATQLNSLRPHHPP